MFFFCIGFYSSIDPVKGRGLDVKKHAIAYLLRPQLLILLEVLCLHCSSEYAISGHRICLKCFAYIICYFRA